MISAIVLLIFMVQIVRSLNVRAIVTIKDFVLRVKRGFNLVILRKISLSNKNFKILSLYCVCKNGFTGPRCEVLTNPCSANPCVKENAKCVSRYYGTYECNKDQ